MFGRHQFHFFAGVEAKDGGFVYAEFVDLGCGFFAFSNAHMNPRRCIFTPGLTNLVGYQTSCTELEDEHQPIRAAEEMARMMNVMAAAANEGSAELPQIKEALQQAGMAAKATGVNFEEANAAIKVLDKVGKKGAEGDVALRNIMMILSKGRFLPKRYSGRTSSRRR